MLLPDNIQPEFTLYYIGGLILKYLKKNNTIPLVDLFQMLKEKNSTISFSSYLLSLDWLFLLNIAEVKDNGRVILCS
jgi:hypothetical protein